MPGRLIRRAADTRLGGTIMHAHGQKLRRVISLLGAAAVAGALVTTVTSATAPSPAAATVAFTLNGSIPGKVITAQYGFPLTFAFTEINNTGAGAAEDLVITKSVGVSSTGPQACVLA